MTNEMPTGIPVTSEGIITPIAPIISTPILLGSTETPVVLPASTSTVTRIVDKNTPTINKMPEAQGFTYSTVENFIQPTLIYDPKTNDYRLVQDYTFEWGTLGARKRLTLRAGFEYDKASVPRLLWGLARPDGPWDGASLLHDRLYQGKGAFDDSFFFETKNQLTGEWQKDSSRWKRFQADDLLCYVGELGGATKFTANLYKDAVRIYPPNWFKGF